jgi:hypothetical protein
MIQATPVQNGVVITGQGNHTMFDITTNTVVKTVPGRIAKISVLVAGTAGAAYDAKTVASAAVTNQLAVIPNVVGVYQVDMPVFNGLVIEPGAGQTVAISYS